MSVETEVQVSQPGKKAGAAKFLLDKADLFSKATLSSLPFSLPHRR